ncbi:class I SAM-dependent methyltransferase [Kineococcus sp. SYSU DK004]|uniref:class I SAM-dependent methyltransferase n=1 Tax=Kineococcus sp. SYSU DK004 TaxID=3383125 RepID=UPI003D7CDC12
MTATAPAFPALPGGAPWPDLDGIPFRRAGREDLALAAVDALAGGDDAAARALLLRDNDDWWHEAPPSVDEAREAAASPTLSRAVEALRLGRVGDYLRYRWSDPAFLAGLALLDRAWPGTGPGAPAVLEVAAGTGVLLRELALRGARRLTGVDVVHAKLWLARRFVLADVPGGDDVALVVADAARAWPPEVEVALGDGDDRVVLCHDAFYFLPDPPATARRLRELAGPGGLVAVGSVPNGARPGPVSGQRMTPQDLASWFPGALLFDDADLVEEVVTGRPAAPRPAAELAGATHVSLVLGGRADGSPEPGAPAHGLPVPGRALRPNPLYGPDGRLAWPSPRYADDYADRSPHLPERLPPQDELAADPTAWARRRVLLDLPEHW